MEAIIVNIGDELLLGQVVNTNASWLGEQLHEAGIEVREILIIPDQEDIIKETVSASLEKVKLVLITGGLGPTKDDITKKALADFFETSLVFDQDMYERIQKMFERWGRNPSSSHKEQCYMPESAQLLQNKMGTAPGMWMEKENKVAVSLPGVPYEMKWIFENGLLDKIQEKFQTKTIYHKTIRTIGLGEAKIAERIEPVLEGMDIRLKIAYLPSLGSVRLRITGSGDNKIEIQNLVDQKIRDITASVPELVYGYDKVKFEEYLGELLKEKGLMMASAESCTGGYLAHMITSIPGSSDYFAGTVVSYTNEMKENLLNVKAETIRNHGAVSEETVLEMLDGLLNVVNADVGVAISGIAGPGGGTIEKPVGTIWIAVGSNALKNTEKLQLGKNRITNIKYTALHALNMLRKFLLAQ